MSKEFSLGVKDEIMEAQHNKCLNCGNVGHLSIHHTRPKCTGGQGTILNGVGLCRGNGTNECHSRADRLTIDYGIPFTEIAREGIAPLESGLPRYGTIFDRPHKTRTKRSTRRSHTRKRH